MDEDAESIDVLSKVLEMHIIQIFGFDGRSLVELKNSRGKFSIFVWQEKIH
jgi:hypothetical protein